MHIDGVFDHLEGWDSLAFVLGVWQSCVWQVETVIHLVGGERWVGGIDYDVEVIGLLYQAVGMESVAFFFDVTEVLGMKPGLLNAVFVAM